MAFAILRIEKLKTAGNIGGLNSHLIRSKETPNADKELSKYNSRPIGSDDLWKDVQMRIEAAGITKLRKDGVLAVEHLMSASPEHFNFEKKIDEQGQVQLWGRNKRWDAFEKAAIEWLQERYGKENLVNVTVHKDEQSPHLHAIVVPIRGGKLNCKYYLGGREKLRDMQSSFAQKVKGQGIERGIEGSKAHHTEVKHFYGHIKQMETPEWDIQLEKPTIQVQAPEKSFIGYKLAPEVVAHLESERINQELKGLHERNQGKAHKRLMELHQAAQGVTLLKQKNKQIQTTLEAQKKELGALKKENDELKQKLLVAGSLLGQVANGSVQVSELKKALEQTPHKGNQREEVIWKVMKHSGLKVKEPEQQPVEQRQQKVEQKPKGHRI